MARIWLCGLLAVGLWWLSLHARFQPEPLGADAPAIQFSAARADAVLGRLLGAQKPHPLGSPENDAVRQRLLTELAGLGVPAKVQGSFGCFGRPQWHAVYCGEARNVVAQLSPGSGKAVLLMAHLDTVPAGPGAADDGSGVATILETLRALKARGLTGTHPVTALFTDGEESGLLGSASYVRAEEANIGAVINMEARGSSGPSLLFQASPGNGPLIDLYARNVPHVASSSLYGEVYKHLDYDTDLTPVLLAGLPGLNFAFLGAVANYHTPRDRRENIPAATLQSHGENALEMADALSRVDPDRLKGGDAVYLDILGRWLPRLQQRWVLPLSLAALVLIALAGLLTRRERREIQRPWTSFLMPPLTLALAVGLGFGLHALAAWISGHADPSFAHPVWLRLSLAFGCFAAVLLTARGAGPIAGWLWFAGLAVAASVWAPGVAPYFLFPALVAAPLLLLTSWGGRGPVLVIAALAALVVWVGLAAGSEQIMGLALHMLFTGAAAFALIALLPVLARANPAALLASCGASLLLALVFAVMAGFQPAFSEEAPQRLNLRYVETGGQGWWVADPVAHLPDTLRAAARFSALPERKGGAYGYVAPADAAHLPQPQVKVARNGDTVIVEVQSQGDRLALEVPREAGLMALSVNGVDVAPPSGTPVTINCACREARLVLTLGSDPGSLPLKVQWSGLASPDGLKLRKARPSWAVPSQAGDVSEVVTDVPIPAR